MSSLIRWATSSTLRSASLLALAAAALSGTANFLNKFAVGTAKDPVAYTTVKNLIVALFLAGIIGALGTWREYRTLTRRQAALLVAIAIVGGSVPFALFFTGLAQTSAVNASLIHKSLFLWVLLFGAPILKERLSRAQWLGIIAIAAANVLVGGFKGFRLNAGEAMIVAATLLWAIENVVAKVALKRLSSLAVASARMILGAVVLAAIAIARGGAGALGAQNAGNLGMTVVTSLVLLGFVVTWYAALKRAPATYVATLLVPATLVTNVLSSVFVTHAMSGLQIANAILLVAGAACMIGFSKTPAAAQAAPAAA